MLGFVGVESASLDFMARRESLGLESWGLDSIILDSIILDFGAGLFVASLESAWLDSGLWWLACLDDFGLESFELESLDLESVRLKRDGLVVWRNSRLGRVESASLFVARAESLGLDSIALDSWAEARLWWAESWRLEFAL